MDVLIGLPPILSKVFRVGPKAGVEPVRHLFIVKQIVGKQRQNLLVTLETLAGLQGQGEEVGVLPVAGAQVHQHRNAAGVEVTDAAQQGQALRF